MLHHHIVPVTAFEQNCTLLWCDETGHAAIVDPGGDLERILGAIREAAVQPVRILLTHGHADHVGASDALARVLDVPIEGPTAADEFLLAAVPLQCQMFGLPAAPAPSVSRWLDHGDVIALGNERLDVLHCPGHTPGHLVYYSPTARLAQVGDVLFRGAIGRTDLPGGDLHALLDAIRERLFPLGDEVRFIPGHGPMSTFGEERRSNPYVGDRARRL